MEHTAELGLVAAVLMDFLASLNGLLLIICMASAILCESYGTMSLCSVVHVVQIRLQQICIAPIWCLCQRDMKRLFLLRAFRLTYSLLGPNWPWHFCCSELTTSTPTSHTDEPCKQTRTITQAKPRAVGYLGQI